MKLFDIADNEKVVSVTKLTEMDDSETNGLQKEKIKNVQIVQNGKENTENKAN